MFLAFLKVDKKKERRNNLIPARIGIYALFTLIICTLVDGLAYSFTVMDITQRVFMIALTSDIYIGILAPALVLYGMPSVRRNVRNYFGTGPLSK